jgi:hypothetical protein
MGTFKQRRLARMARDTQQQLSSLTDIDKAPLLEALGSGAPARAGATTRSTVAVNGPASSTHLRPVRASAPRDPDRDVVGNGNDDTMLVTSIEAWDLYRRTAAYICEPGRAYRPMRFVAFFVDNVLQREIPRIIAVRDAVPFDAREQRRLMDSGTELDLRLAEVIATARQLGLSGAPHQVYLLTAPGQPGHVQLPSNMIMRDAKRRPAGFAPRQHYTSVDRLSRARPQR